MTIPSHPRRSSPQFSASCGAGYSAGSRPFRRLFFVAPSFSQTYKNPSAPTETRIDDLASRMTLEGRRSLFRHVRLQPPTRRPLLFIRVHQRSFKFF
jgi:hypothetical protein